MSPAAAQSPSSASRRLGVALIVLVAVLLRGAIPAGWMPNTHGVPNAPLIICTATGSQLVLADDKGGHAPARSHQQHDLCAFAGLASAPPPVLAALPAPFTLADAAVVAPVENVALVMKRGHREQAARAPPVLV